MNARIHSFIASPPGQADPKDCGIYPGSVHFTECGVVFMIKDGPEDVLVAPVEYGFEGESFFVGGRNYTIAELSHENAIILRAKFPFTAPIPVLKHPRSVGLGDRLGIATPGHAEAIEKYDAYPVFAQQSIRELNLTNRTFENVLDCVSFAVFREGFTRGFGADGDHLKTVREVEYALSCGYSMITLDCSEHIKNNVMNMTDREVEAAYVKEPVLEAKYLNKTFRIGEYKISFDEPTFRRMCLIYNGAIEFAVSVYEQFFAGREDELEFEVSIDETLSPTLPAQHFYVASELFSRGVRPATIAPKFCGEFQKGVDYRGDLGQFEKEIAEHALIAEHFGYKLSVHSGSDKFSVFALVGKYTRGRFHLKTAGTSWLEAMAVIAQHDPGLYRRIHSYAMEYAFDEARKYYHVSTDLSKIPDLETLRDEELCSLLAQEDERQLIHITYGMILNAKNPDGSDRFRTRLYEVWRCHGREYAHRLNAHIGRHLEALYSGIETGQQEVR